MSLCWFCKVSSFPIPHEPQQPQVAGLRSPHNPTPVAIPCWRFESFGHYKLLPYAEAAPPCCLPLPSQLGETSHSHAMLPQRVAAGGPKATGAAHFWKSSPCFGHCFSSSFQNYLFSDLTHSLEGLCCHVLLIKAFYPPYTYRLQFYSGLAGNITLCWCLSGNSQKYCQEFLSCSRSCSKVPDMIFIHESPQR